MVRATQPHGSWSEEQQQLHINVLELTAAHYGLQSLWDKDYSCHIQIHTDEYHRRNLINNFGGIRSWLCDSVANQIWDSAITQHNWVLAVFIYILRYQNIEKQIKKAILQ